EVDEQVADRPVVRVDRHEGPAVIGVRQQLLDRARIVVRQEVGIELPEKVAGGALDLDQCGEVIGAGRPDRHSGSPLPCDHGPIPRSGSAGSSSIAKYASRWPSGSRKYTAAAGIQPITLGSVVSAAWNDSGVTPCARRRSHASSTPSSWVLK